MWIFVLQKKRIHIIVDEYHPHECQKKIIHVNREKKRKKKPGSFLVHVDHFLLILHVDDFLHVDHCTRGSFLSDFTATYPGELQLLVGAGGL